MSPCAAAMRGDAPNRLSLGGMTMSVRTVFMLLSATGIMAAMWGCPKGDVEEDLPAPTTPAGPVAQDPGAAPETEPEPEPEPTPVAEEEPAGRDMPEPAETWTGTVVGVTDADRLEVLRAGEVVKLRVYGVDAPERRQAFGPLARRLTTRMVMGRQVTVHELDLEKYDHQGRTVAEVITPEGDSLAEALVREGLAWWYDRYVPGDELLASLQSEARAEGRGLWADAYAVAPWEFRDGKPGAPWTEAAQDDDGDAAEPAPSPAPGPAA